MKKICLKDKKEFGMVDLFRIICSIGVIMIHLKPFSTFGGNINFFVTNVVTRLCVPFFFMTSGFFVERKINDWDKVKKYLKNMLRLYVVYTIINIPMIIKDYEGCGKGARWCIDTFIKSFILSGSYMQLWYYAALIVATLGLYFLSTKLKIKDKNIGIIAGILLVIGILGSGVYAEILSVDYEHWKISVKYYEYFLTTRNGIFFGFPFMYIGYIISKYKEYIYFNILHIIIGFGLFGVMIGEAFFLRKFLKPWMGLDMTFCLVPTAICFFLMIVFAPMPKKLVEKVKHFRKLSVMFFGLHMLVNNYTRDAIYLVVGHNLKAFYSFLVIIVILFFIAEGIIYLSEKDGFKWMKKLY